MNGMFAQKMNTNFLWSMRDSTSLITYQQSVLKDYDVWVSNHDSELSVIEINGNRGELTSYVIDGVDYNTIVWNDGIYAYSLSSNIELEKLIHIAETIH